MQRVAFLIPEPVPAGSGFIDGNYLRFANELTARGCEVSLCTTDTLALSRSRVSADGWRVSGELSEFENPGEPTRFLLNEFATIWVFSLGKRASFLDKFQMLYALGTNIRFINSLDAIMHLKSKYFITSLPEMIRHPETHAATNPSTLLAIVNESDKSWVAKPPAGSLGRDVFLLQPGDTNNSAILEHLCGPDQDQYTLLQEHIGAIRHGEKRVLLAGGKVIGQYKRTSVNDHRTNLLQGANSEACELTEDERNCCNEIGVFLTSMGANYVGLDMVYPWIIEFNVINPGGLITIEQLTGENLAPQIISQLDFT